jgi:hypothetical protein
LKKPLVVFNDRLPAAPHSQCCFNPDESLIVTGTCEVPKSDDLGALVCSTADTRSCLLHSCLRVSYDGMRLISCTVGYMTRLAGSPRLIPRPPFAGVLRQAKAGACETSRHGSFRRGDQLAPDPESDLRGDRYCCSCRSHPASLSVSHCRRTSGSRLHNLALYERVDQSENRRLTIECLPTVFPRGHCR